MTTNEDSQQPQLTYQLLKIPTADLHVASILIQALGEVLRIDFAGCSAVAILRISILLLSSHRVVGNLLLRRLTAGTTSKHSSDRMTDGGPNSYTTNIELAGGNRNNVFATGGKMVIKL